MKRSFSKKQIAILVLSLLLGLFLCACNKQMINEETSNTPESLIEETIAPVEEQIAEYKLGDTIETDIVRITLNNAQLAIKLKMTSYGTYDQIQSGNTVIDKDYCTADEYDPEEDLGLAYVASKGHTYVVVQFLVENLDRGSIDLNDTATIEYNGQEYNKKFDFKASSENGYEWARYDSSNVLLLPGEATYYRGYLDINTDVEDLDDDFNIILSLPQSDGDTIKFKYIVKAEERQVIENQEISLEEALSLFLDQEGMDYFTNHMGEYTVLSGADIETSISGNKFDLQKKESYGSWSGKYHFESDGRVQETIYDGSVGYFNDVHWSVNGNKLTIETGSNRKIDEYEVRMITSKTFLLSQNGKPVGLMSKD